MIALGMLGEWRLLAFIVRSPLMQRRDLPGALLASAVGTALPATDESSPRGAAPYYSQTSAEHAAGVVPSDYRHPPGCVLRYGADPSGNSDSSGAWSRAIKANAFVYDGYPGGGSYRFDSEVVIARYPVTICGSAKQIGGGTGGTMITLSRAAGRRSAALRTASWASCVRIERIRFAWQALGDAQFALRFAELRSARILDCAFIGDHSPSNSVIGIRFDGSGTYTGDVTVRDNYFSGLLGAIELAGSCSSVRIVENEMYGYVQRASSCAIRASEHVIETVIAFNSLEGWTIGIATSGGYIKQLANTYEANETNFEWTRGAGNARIWNMSVAEAFVSGGAPRYPMNDTDACMVLSGPGIGDFDSMSLNARRGLYSYGRIAKEGDWTREPFDSESYGAGTSAAWNVSVNPHTHIEYTRIGHTLLANFRVESSAIAGIPPSHLTVRLPGNETAVSGCAATCYVNDGTEAIAKVQVDPGATVLRLSKLNDQPFNIGRFACWGSIAFACG